MIVFWNIKNGDRSEFPSWDHIIDKGGVRKVITDPGDWVSEKAIQEMFDHYELNNSYFKKYTQEYINPYQEILDKIDFLKETY